MIYTLLLLLLLLLFLLDKKEKVTQGVEAVIQPLRKCYETLQKFTKKTKL